MQHFVSIIIMPKSSIWPTLASISVVAAGENRKWQREEAIEPTLLPPRHRVPIITETVVVPCRMLASTIRASSYWIRFGLPSASTSFAITFAPCNERKWPMMVVEERHIRAHRARLATMRTTITSSKGSSGRAGSLESRVKTFSTHKNPAVKPSSTKLGPSTLNKSSSCLDAWRIWTLSASSCPIFSWRRRRT